MIVMTVEKLIEELNRVKNKSLPVYVWNSRRAELAGFVSCVDDALETRVDIDINGYNEE